MCLVLFLVLSALVITGRTSVIDHDLIVRLRSSAAPLMTTVLLAVTFTSGKLAIPAAILFAYLLYRRDGLRAARCYATACLTAQILNALLKYEMGRPRPHGISPRLTGAGGFSYPSADVMMAVVIFGLATLILSRTISSGVRRVLVRSVAIAFILATAIARVYLGAHWPSDVLGALLVGTACAACWANVLTKPSIPAPISSAPFIVPGDVLAAPVVP